MNADGHHTLLHFEPTLTLGTIIHIVAMAIILVTFWVRMDDRTTALEMSREDTAQIIKSQTELIQDLQVEQAKETVLMDELERRIEAVENSKSFPNFQGRR